MGERSSAGEPVYTPGECDAAVIGSAVHMKHWMMRRNRAVLPEGDFRNRNDIEAWAGGIARALGTP